MEAAGVQLPETLYSRYGAEAQEIHALQQDACGPADPEGFPLLEAQLRHAIRTSMVVHLSDFYFRRVPLYLARADHGGPWIEALVQVWREERGLSQEEALREKERLLREIEQRSAWLQRSAPVEAVLSP
jgi:glycerol-3-phosphate dehydrogenase